MSGFSHLAFAAVLLSGLGGIAQAQTARHVDDAAFDRYDASVDGRSVVIDQPANESGVVPPSESQTVMGLRVPR